MTVAVVLKGYPRLSETFIAQELHGLQERGLAFEIWSLRQPYDPDIHPIHREIRAPVRYLPEYLHDEPWRVLKAWWAVRRRPGYRAALTAFWSDLKRDFTRNRVRRFGQGLVLAHELPGTIDRIYVHFLHTPAAAARYAAKMRDLPWSCSAHAKDIYTSPDWDLREKLADMDWLVTCTAANVAHLKALAPETADKVALLYHGLDLARFEAPAPRDATQDAPSPAGPDETATDRPVEILSVGRAVAKKGYSDLLTALAALPPALNWRFTHIGGGELRGHLKTQAAGLGISERCRWLGPKPQSDVLAAYRASDVFVLASRIADDGDRDGLPNVLMEAQSQGLACVSTRVSAIPELIIDGETGVLVAPDNPGALRDALATLLADPPLRQQLGAEGAARVRRDFGHDAGLDRLGARFGLPPLAAHPGAADPAPTPHATADRPPPPTVPPVTAPAGASDGSRRASSAPADPNRA